MKSTNRICGWLAILFFGVSGSTALAWQPPTVSAISCQLRHEVMADPSPIPAWCYWDYIPGTETLFEATVVDGEGTNCADYWRVYCRADSLGFDGTWPSLEGIYVRSVMYTLDMTCSLQVLEPTRLVVSGGYTDPLLVPRRPPWS